MPSRGLFRSLTVTFEALSDEPKQHLPAVVAEGRSSVRVHVERVGPNLEIFKGGCSWKETRNESAVTVGITNQPTVPKVLFTPRGVTHSGSGGSLTREHHLHQVSLLDVTGTFHKLQDVVGGGVMFEQQNLVVDAVKAAFWELRTQTERENLEWGRSTVQKKRKNGWQTFRSKTRQSTSSF